MWQQGVRPFSKRGIWLVASILSLPVSAQYVDLEAERAAAAASGRAPASEKSTAATPVDPYGARPAQTYPATSYGVNTAPTATAALPAASANAGQPATRAGGSEVGNLVLQVQQLQQEVMRLNGKVEEQSHELATLKEQSLQRYIDLDKRLAGGTKPVADDRVVVTPPAAPSAAPSAGSKPQVGEAEAYRASYALVQGRQFEQAIPAFKQFLQRYPDGQYSANAHYWLGELYLVLDPPDLESARQSFVLLLSEYPDNPKAPDALYKLGKVQFLKGNREKAREYLDQVITLYGGSNTAAVTLASDFIDQNY